MSTVDIVIPVQKETALLEGCVKSVAQYTNKYRLHIIKNPTSNVSEARQEAMNKLHDSEYICFLDDDTRIMHHGWLDELLKAFNVNKRIAVAFAEEDWGEFGLLQQYKDVIPVDYGPAACMLINKKRIPEHIKWDKYIGLKTGWLGGDFEEVEYAFKLKANDLYCAGVEKARFLHIDRPSFEEFRKTDRAKTCQVMQALIRIKYLACPDNNEFFRKLQYVKANRNNDRMLASGKTLKTCFYNVLKDNNLLHYPMFRQWGLTD